MQDEVLSDYLFLVKDGPRRKLAKFLGGMKLRWGFYTEHIP
jgi:hypothetical protein